MQWTDVLATRMSRMKASEIRELLKLLDQPDIISFAGGIPDPALFPAKAYAEAFTEALTESAGAALQYSVSEGYRPLRDWLVAHMAQIGIPCAAENILITSGSQQALDYLGKLLLSPGDTALVTAPTYLGALQAFAAYEPRYDELRPEQGNRTPGSYADAAHAKETLAHRSSTSPSKTHSSDSLLRTASPPSSKSSDLLKANPSQRGFLTDQLKLHRSVSNNVTTPSESTQSSMTTS